MTEENKIKRSGQMDAIVSAFTFLGGVGGLLSLLLVVFNGGALTEKVRANENRLLSLETFGAPVIQAYMKSADARDIALERRVSEIERLVTQISEMKGEMKVNTFKLDAVKSAVDRLEGLKK